MPNNELTAYLSAIDPGPGVTIFTTTYEGSEDYAELNNRDFQRRKKVIGKSSYSVHPKIREQWKLYSNYVKSGGTPYRLDLTKPGMCPVVPFAWVFRRTPRGTEQLVAWEGMELFAGDIVEVGSPLQFQIQFLVGGAIFLGEGASAAIYENYGNILKKPPTKLQKLVKELSKNWKFGNSHTKSIIWDVNNPLGIKG